MSYPIASVIIAGIAGLCFERWLSVMRLTMDEALEFNSRLDTLSEWIKRVDFQSVSKKDLETLAEKLETQEKAIKNLAEQALSEISKIKDRMGTLQLATGFKRPAQEKTP